MMVHHLTGYSDVDAVLAELLAGVRGTLGPQLVGLYLDGSLATGDFAEHSSDIDVLVVTEDVLSEEVVATLGTMQARLATGMSKWARELEVSSIPRGALRRFDPDDNCHPCIQRGSDQLVTESNDRDWVIHRHVVREHGLALAGPDPGTPATPLTVSGARSSDPASPRGAGDREDVADVGDSNAVDVDRPLADLAGTLAVTSRQAGSHQQRRQPVETITEISDRDVRHVVGGVTACKLLLELRRGCLCVGGSEPRPFPYGGAGRAGSRATGF